MCWLDEGADHGKVGIRGGTQNPVKRDENAWLSWSLHFGQPPLAVHHVTVIPELCGSLRLMSRVRQ